MTINKISKIAISRIAREVFGANTQVDSITQIVPVSEYGIYKISGCNANLSYVVALRSVPKKFVFRFNRGFREDFFDTEIHNYRVITDKTDIPTPKIYCVDRSKKIVPTSYMVMDYMVGDEGTFLSHPNNPKTDKEEKEEIQRKMGYCYAEIHNITRKAKEADVEIKRLLYRLEQLEHVVKDGQYRIDLKKIDLCRSAVKRDRHLLLETESLCVADSELHFAKVNGEWKVSFICDMESLGFGDPYSDLTISLVGCMGLLDLNHPLVIDDAAEVSRLPFFQGYEGLRQINYDRLLSTSIYFQLGLWCAITDQIYRPEKREFMKSKESTIVNLVEAVAEKSLI